MTDLGQQLYNERRYDFSSVFVRHLMFRSDGDEVLFNCKVLFNGRSYSATMCATFDQFNTLLMQSGDREFRREVSALMGEAMTMEDHKKLQTSFQINLLKIFGRPLRVRGCTYQTNLVVLPLEELAEQPEKAYVFVVRSLKFQRALG